MTKPSRQQRRAEAREAVKKGNPQILKNQGIIIQLLGDLQISVNAIHNLLMKKEVYSEEEFLAERQTIMKDAGLSVEQKTKAAPVAENAPEPEPEPKPEEVE